MAMFSDWTTPTEIPQALLDIGFTDASYHHDAGPKVEKKVGTQTFVVALGGEDIGADFDVKLSAFIETDGQDDVDVLYAGDNIDDMLRAVTNRLGMECQCGSCRAIRDTDG